MSRELPARPNLEHLKNQAKDRLLELRQRDAHAQLADAQHAVAREYGFASWPKLKAHLEWLSVEPPPGGQSFVGTWIANVEKSRHPARSIQRATLEIGVAGDKVTMDDVVIETGGREERHRNTLYTDGQEHPSDYGNGYVLRAMWRGPRVLEVAARKDAEDIGRTRYEVSADGQTLTISDPTGQLVSVFDRT